MQEKDMILLLELVDDLLRLNEAIKNLGGLGYQERFQKLDNVYEVLKNNSVFADCEDDEEMRRFYEIVDRVEESVESRAKILVQLLRIPVV
ncbi:MAG: hypothetical protein IJD40_01490 [Lachnospiraceae bacterium]|nr:hypothetical protein [Lachnospiraceae bacterium]